MNEDDYNKEISGMKVLYEKRFGELTGDVKAIKEDVCADVKPAIKRIEKALTENGLITAVSKNTDFRLAAGKFLTWAVRIILSVMLLTGTTALISFIVNYFKGEA